MKTRRFLTVAFCLAGLACDSDPVVGPTAQNPNLAPAQTELQGVIAVADDGPLADVILQATDGRELQLVGERVGSLRRMPGAFVTVRGTTGTDNSSVFTVESYELIDEPFDEVP